MQHLWIIPILPLFGFVLNGLFGRRLSKPAINVIAVGSVVFVFLMVAVHGPQIGITFGRPWAWMIGVFVVGWLVTLWMYSVAGKLRGA